jgi:DNA-binding NtrC family response regulator
MQTDTASARSPRHLIRILVFIDDDALLDHVIENLLEQGYAEITHVRDPEELSMALRMAAFDLVISVSRTDQVFIGNVIRATSSTPGSTIFW